MRAGGPPIAPRWSHRMQLRLLRAGVLDGVVEEFVELFDDAFEWSVGVLGAGEDDGAFDGGYRDRAERACALLGEAGARQHLGVELLPALECLAGGVARGG